MHRQAILIIAATLAGWCATHAARADQVLQDAQLLQGSWAGMYAEQNGEQMSYDDVGFLQFLVRGDRFLFQFGPHAIAAGQFRLNTWALPRQIDLMVISGPEAGSLYLGIYEIEGSTQQICFAPPGQPRPTEFSTFPGSGYSLYVWLRAARVYDQRPAPRNGVHF